MTLRLALLACSCFIAACSPAAPSADTAAAPTAAAESAAASTPAPAAPAADGKERFYGREVFTITHELSGSEKGSVTEHVRDWGRTRVESPSRRSAWPG